MAQYDPSKEKVIAHESIENNGQKYSVKVFTYNGGLPKISPLRHYTISSGEERMRSLFPCTAEEMKAVAPLIATMSNKFLLPATDKTKKE